MWLVSTGQATWEEVFCTKPPVRKILQEEITALRHEWSEDIWLDTFAGWTRALCDIVGVNHAGIAITSLRFLIEMRGLKAIGDKILHLETVDEQAHIAPELRNDRSEAELDRPEVLMLRDAYLLNRKDGVDKRRQKVHLV
jgi:hypothetical protein